VPKDIKILELPKLTTAIDSAITFFKGDKTNSEIRRLFQQNAVSQNGKKITDIKTKISDGDVIKIGKRVWFRIKLK